MAANPEAIAWYLRRSEDLLAELRDRVLLLRARGAQLAGFTGAILALAGANVDSTLGAAQGAARVFAGCSLLTGIVLLVVSLVVVLRGSILPESVSAVSTKEVANYVTERFTNEPDLWRVHLRTIHGTFQLIELTSVQGDRAERALRKAEYFFLAGLFTVAAALATLIVVTL